MGVSLSGLDLAAQGVYAVLRVDAVVQVYTDPGAGAIVAQHETETGNVRVVRHPVGCGVPGQPLFVVLPVGQGVALCIHGRLFPGEVFPAQPASGGPHLRGVEG